MPRSLPATSVLPPAAAEALRRLGDHLAVARVRRKESQRLWAQRVGVSVPTIIRMEQGDAGVAMGTYATALWLIGRVSALPDTAAPQHDQGALEMDVREAVRKRAVRSPASIEARLGRKAPARD